MNRLKHVLVRLWPLAAVGVGAFIASPSFRHYVDAHPQFSPVALVLVAVLHALTPPKPTS